MPPLPMPPLSRHALEPPFCARHQQASSRSPSRIAPRSNRATRCSAEARTPRADWRRRQRPPAAAAQTRRPPATSSSSSSSSSFADMNAAARAEAVSRLLLVENSDVFVGALPWKEDDDDDDDEGDGERRASSSFSSSSSSTTTSTPSLTPAAMAATTDLVAGATRWRRALDAALSSLCGRSVEELDAPLRQVLRVALYELASTCGRREREEGSGEGESGGGPSRSRRRLGRDPAAAAAGIVAAAVDLARSGGVGHAGSAKLANAVLRKAAAAILEEEREVAEETLSPSPSPSSSPVPLLPRSLLPPLPPPGAPERARLRSLAVSWSHPDWLVRRWARRFGAEGAEALLAANNRRPRHALRAIVSENDAEAENADVAPALLLGRALDSLVKDDSDEDERRKKKLVEWRRSAVLPREFVVVERGMGAALAALVVKKKRPTATTATTSKTTAPSPLSVVSAAVQDEASASVVALADPRPGERVLDVCAAPGGKTLFAAARMKGRGLLVARDSSAARLRPLREAAEAQGVRAPFLVVEEADGRGRREKKSEEEEEEEKEEQNLLLFDLVLVDAPCSGTGVLGKRADARWRKKESDLASLAALQDALLAAASRAVRPGGGRLVYSTCSLEPEENGERVRAFLASEAGRGFELDGGVDAAALGLPSGMVTAEGFLEALPHVHGTDGAFGARMVRRW